VMQHIFANDGAITFDPRKLSYVQVNQVDLFIAAACKGSPYQNISQVLTAKKPVTVLDITSFLMLRLLLPAYNVPSRFISGYTGATLGSGCLRGDGDLAGSPPSDFTDAAETAMNPGITPLLLGYPAPANSTINFLNTAAPTFKQFFTQHPPATAQGKKMVQFLEEFYQDGIEGGVTGPPGIPRGRLLALQAAFKYAAATPQAQKTFLDLGVPAGYVNPDTVVPWLNDMYNYRSQVAQWFKLTGED
jgi:hypothetical protein